MDFKNMTPEVALQGFGSGFDCSTCTLAHVADRIGLDEETAVKISGAFGGGMWRGDTCGAVVGALMAIGMKYAQTEAGDEETKNNMLAKKAEFEKRFSEKYGSLICREILGYDLSTEEGMAAIMEQELLAKKCPYVVCDACEILEEILG